MTKKEASNKINEIAIRLSLVDDLIDINKIIDDLTELSLILMK